MKGFMLHVHKVASDAREGSPQHIVFGAQFLSPLKIQKFRVSASLKVREAR